METHQEQAGEAPPEPQKPRWITIYNASNRGQKVTIHNGKRLMPGLTARVPYALGAALIEKVPYIKRAARGDIIR